MYAWQYGQSNRITFVMVDSSNTEVAGLGAGLTLRISKNGGAFAPVAGTQTEIGNGWYSYLATAAEADTVGPISIYATAPGCVQQNLEYVVTDRASGAVAFTYAVTSSVGATPIEGASVHVTSDAAGAVGVADGVTDAAGEVVFTLQPGTYYFWTTKAGYAFTNPDPEVVV